jgi:hypothetical protein
MPKRYKIVVYVPVSSADRIREILGKTDAGHIGNYDYTSFSVKGTGRFRPLAGAKPAVGEVGKLETVEEERIETVVEEELLEEAVFQIRKAHPYEEPVIDVYRLENV